ncbi:DsbA family protein [Candidatus Mesenet endosymbiont of Phosphuga atrata]|uniref:DsbA family protein n=1 Tax=Candidatus Mesenet endosymbiont of Phosphuga atrata TaxID=3066221 RepID=UPI0030CA9849
MYGKVFLFLFLVLISTHLSEAQEQHFSNDSKFSTNISDLIADDFLKVLPDDRVIGDKNAPITMIEYASFSCYHCALFYINILPIIEKEYIKTGRVLFIFRSFPLDYKSLKASMLGHCYDNTADYFAFNKAVFSLTDFWNNKSNSLTALENIARLSNISKEKFDQCINDSNVLNMIINQTLLTTEKLKITGTPVFFINGKRHEGIHSLKYFTTLFDNIIK